MCSSTEAPAEKQRPPWRLRELDLLGSRTEPGTARATLILEALERCDGHREKAAEMLGVSVRTLYNRLREYGIRG